MKFDVRNRRKRQYRVSTGASHQVTPRDIAIFELLQRYRFLRTRQIRALLPDGLRGCSEKRFRERLGLLFHEGYLGRPKQQRRNMNFYYTDSIYELDERGMKFMSAIGPHQDTHHQVGGGIGAGRQFVHAMMIVDTLVSIEQGVRADRNTRLLHWREILERVPAATRCRPNLMQLPRVPIAYTYPGSGKAIRAEVAPIPDAIFAIEYPTGFILFLLEAEHRDTARRTNLHGNSLLKKLLAYRELRRRRLFFQHFGTDAIVVLVAVPSATRVRTCLSVVSDVTGGKGSTLFAFHHVPAFAEALLANPAFPPLYAEPWARAGFPPFQLDKVSSDAANA